MGMVPNLVTGVWVGAEDRAAHFKTYCLWSRRFYGITNLGNVHEKLLCRQRLRNF